MKKILIFLVLIIGYFNSSAQICLKTADGSYEIKITAVSNETKDLFILYKGETQKVKLKFVKENIKICNECAHPEVFNHYNEMVDDKLTGGVYVIHFKENKYELTYTRFTDKKIFAFSGPSSPGNCTW